MVANLYHSVLSREKFITRRNMEMQETEIFLETLS